MHTQTGIAFNLDQTTHLMRPHLSISCAVPWGKCCDTVCTHRKWQGLCNRGRSKCSLCMLDTFIKSKCTLEAKNFMWFVSLNVCVCETPFQTHGLKVKSVGWKSQLWKKKITSYQNKATTGWKATHDILHRGFIHLTKTKPNCRGMIQ